MQDYNKLTGSLPADWLSTGRLQVITIYFAAVQLRLHAVFTCNATNHSKDIGQGVLSRIGLAMKCRPAHPDNGLLPLMRCRMLLISLPN